MTAIFKFGARHRSFSGPCGRVFV